MAGGKFDIKQIPDFDCLESMFKWVEKMDLVYELCGVKQIEQAFAVYQLLSWKNKSDSTRVKNTLFPAFAKDSFMAHGNRCSVTYFSAIISSKMSTGYGEPKWRIDIFWWQRK